MSVSRLPDGRVPVVLSAHDENLIATDAHAVLGYLDRTPCEVAQVAAQLTATRRVRRHRAVLRAADRAELTDGLRALVDGREHPLIARSARRERARSAFVFPGQGGQWPAMGADAYNQLPAYRAEADRLDDVLQRGGMPSALPFLTTPADTATVSQQELHSAQFVHAVALAAVWRSVGLVPDLTVGHSLGEVAAAYVAGVITLRDAVAVLVARARAIAATAGRHGVAVLGVDPADVDGLIAATPGWLELSAVNASRSVAVAGESSAIAAIVAAVAGRGQFARELAMSFPAHTSAMDGQRDALMCSLAGAAFTESPVQFVGSATGSVVTTGTDFAAYWYANLRNTIRFDQAAQAVIAHGAGSFLEMSAHPALLFAIEDALEQAPGADAVLVGSGRRDEPVTEQLSTGIVAAAVADPAYRWADLLTGAPQPLRGFPGAPMRADHLWATAAPLEPIAQLTVTTESWQPRPDTRPGEATATVALLDLDVSSPQARTLRATLTEHPGAILTEPSDADILVVVAPTWPGLDPIAALADRIDSGLLSYADQIGPRCRTVWLLTTAAETVTAHDPPAEPAQAALASMHRSIGFEHPDQAFHHLDLPDADSAANPAVAEAILSGSGEIALRDEPARWYRRALGEDISAARPWELTDALLAHVVITGGSGAIGLSYARYLAAHGAARITLLSRHGLEAAAVAELSAHGSHIDAPPCDITDTAQLAAAADACAGTGATLVIHAAGSASFAPRAEVTGAALADMTAAKVTGLDRFVHTWPIRRGAPMLLCSSVIGVWGGKGTAGYAAANRLLDVTAARLRADGHHCVSVRWGLWEGAGIIDAAETARVERAGLKPMDPERAVEASLADYPRDPLILRADRERLRILFGADTGTRGELAAPSTSDDSRMAAPAAVRSQLAVVLDVEATSLDLDATLFDLGVDSLLALDLRKRLKKLTGQTVPLATLLGGITGTDLIAAIEESEPLA